MLRRDALRLLGSATIPALAGLRPEQLQALGRDTVGGVTTARRHALFDERQHATIDQVAELILPATDTPGARAAGVAGFIEVIVAEYYRDEERAAFLRGLAELDPRSLGLFGRAFMDCVEAQQVTVLTGLEAESRAMPAGAPQHFFARMKGLTLYGYYTSEIGYRDELLQTFMPGRYDGNAPLTRRPPSPSGGH